ncbi:plasmepsin 4, putative [Perkinsus marinus ATCC 50983]|uniref:Plasmepsin 4, putative n=1 Tax=Perkinsus marinus (strain ATCC 50983 / TXsc) TaxID=423536 RepID=C5LSR7_PERM5|nr:plasmepsin 4, putative [Perkinsus marinus ATCC 50983]EER00308.1 plasmepsin 4, putative [Perkinsus marinus ATCC 50983]|eukprot:XP_002767590.1 plasmepsin 4, putative [Perkinsus marinus ATCC 50983]
MSLPLPMPMRLLALVYVFGVLKVTRGNTLKLDVRLKDVRGFGFGLFHTLVDKNGQKLDVLVDTGSDSFFLIWKHWLEKDGRILCKDWPMGCFECSPPCSVSKVTRTVTFGGGMTVKTFQHKAELTVGHLPQNLTFGLVFEWTPRPDLAHPPVNLMGLGYDRGFVNFPSMMTQLRSSRTVSTGIIALYLYPPADPKEESADGGLLLGGGDPGLYEGALKYIDFSTHGRYTVNIDKLQVGNGHITSNMNMNALLDTGCIELLVPGLYYDNLIKDIEAQTDKAAGEHVDFVYHPERKRWYFPCRYMTKLPPLQFYLGPRGTTLFSMRYMHYAKRVPNKSDVCRLLIQKIIRNEWIFPDRILIDNYFQFDPTLKRVGIGKLKPRSP